MPIRRELFETGLENSEGRVTNLIIDFFKIHQDMAYTASEIGWEIKKGYGSVTYPLKKLVTTGFLQRKVMGRITYFMYKGKSPKSDLSLSDTSAEGR